MESKQSTLIHEEGKIDIHHRVEQYRRALEKFEIDKTIIPENKVRIANFLRDCTLGKTVKGKSKKKIGPARCLKYLSMLTRISEELQKPFDDITQLDMEQFVQNLEEGKMLTRSNKPFSDESKTDYKKTIKKFWKWKDGNNSHYPEIVEWLDTSVKVKEIPALSRQEVEKLIDFSPNARQKAIIMVLFDSGARIEELLNVRLKSEHVYWNYDSKCYMIRLEFSKTKPRTISLPLSTKHLQNWLDVHPQKDNPQSQLFPISYQNLRSSLYRFGKKILDKRVTPHVLRHSSATYFANKLNHYQLCYRYGWTMSSDQVNRYIDRAGILEQETAEIVTKSEIDKANTESRQLQEQVIQLREANEQLSEDMSSVMKELQLLKEGKGFMKLLLSLNKEQQKGSKAQKPLESRGFDNILGKPMRV